MNRFRPFRGIYYNQEKSGDLDLNLCPPYDVISEEEKKFYQTLSPYNAVHIVLSEIEFANNFFRELLKKQILVYDTKESFYLLTQEFTYQNKNFFRKGVIGLLKLENFQRGKILPHEKIFSRPKQEQKNFLKKTKAYFSPIFGLIELEDFNSWTVDEDFNLKYKDKDGVIHILQKISSPDIKKKIEQAIEEKEILIADGHHRYTAALEEFPDNYIMTYLTDINSKDLIIFPTHRLVKKERIKPDFINYFFEYFQVEKISDLQMLINLLETKQDNCLGIIDKNNFYFLKIKDFKIVKELNPQKSDYFCRLPVTILNSLIFGKILQIPLEEVSYTKDIYQAVELSTQQNYISFLMPQIKGEEIKKIVENSELMPEKTTYFYPKLPSGLVIAELQ